jgi:hypothetical protein
MQPPARPAARLYSIAVPSNPAQTHSPRVLTSLRARCLVAAGFRERVVLHIDGGAVVALEYAAGGAGCKPGLVLPSLSIRMSVLSARQRRRARRACSSWRLHSVPYIEPDASKRSVNVVQNVVKTLVQSFYATLCMQRALLYTSSFSLNGGRIDRSLKPVRAQLSYLTCRTGNLGTLFDSYRPTPWEPQWTLW